MAILPKNGEIKSLQDRIDLVLSLVQDGAATSQINSSPTKLTEERLRELESIERIDYRKSKLEVNDSMALERILGTNDLLHINFLSKGLYAAKSVCRIHIRNERGHPEGYGTGFMVSPRLLLTNHHVLPEGIIAHHSRAEFSVEYDDEFESLPIETFNFNPEGFFYSNQAFDFCLVALSETGFNGESLAAHRYLQLAQQTGKALLNERVSIIQHPRGGEKQVSLHSNRVVGGSPEGFIHYQADTEPGSSGAAVFNDKWQVVALHRAGVPSLTDPDIWVANQGVRISAIFKNLGSPERRWSPSQAGYLEELGDVSEGSFNTKLIKYQKEHHIVAQAKRPKYKQLPVNLGQSVAQPITLNELQQKIISGDWDEGQLSVYFRQTRLQSRGIDPVFELNPDLVYDLSSPVATESAQLLNSANWLCKRHRQKLYEQRLEENPNSIRIVSEGDSWFQYPFLLEDVIDHIMGDEKIALFSLGEAGDLLSRMAAKEEYVDAILEHQPSYLLLSGGGNDLVDGEGITRFLRPPKHSFDPLELINHETLLRFRRDIERDYSAIFRSAISAKPDIKIIVHGYSYPIPNDGKWLGGPMNKLGITDRAVQRELMRYVIDELNQSLQKLQATYPDVVLYVDVRDIVPERGWYDEFHPTNRYFGAVASAVFDKILPVH